MEMTSEVMWPIPEDRTVSSADADRTQRTKWDLLQIKVKKRCKSENAAFQHGLFTTHTMTT